jgi:hypothetical protein
MTFIKANEATRDVAAETSEDEEACEGGREEGCTA